jgi:hypothetical protein
LKSTQYCAVALLLLLVACNQGGQQDAADSGGAALGQAADTLAFPPEPPLDDSFHALEFAVPSYTPVRERGTGVVHPNITFDPGGARADTVFVRTRPDTASPVVARLIRTSEALHTLEVRSTVSEGGALEYGYEDAGLPVLDNPDGAAAPVWLRVYYGKGPTGEPLEGFVRNDSTRVSLFWWRDRLPESPLFFLVDDSIQFHASPDGATVQITLARGAAPDRFDYIINSLETRGAWMRAEVVTPSNYCFDPPAPRRDTVWLRYLDERQSPRVWYFTRGC